ncbi:MAG TPA: branched-chain amino acid ABC transporter permease [Bacilli bacterium]
MQIKKQSGFPIDFKKQTGLAVFIVFFFSLPFFMHNYFYQEIILLIFLYAGLGCAWNILGGYTGQLSLGHAAYFGLGAYAYALSVDSLGIIPAIILAWIIPAVLAIPIGWITFRLRGPYFALGTIAFAQILQILATDQLKDFTRGSAGLLVHSIMPQPQYYYYLMLAFFIVSFLVMRSVAESKLGYYLMAIREDENTAQVVTINTTWYKNVALFISASLTGIGGAFYASMLGMIEPVTVFGIDLSNEIVFLVILGGVGTLWGPLVGAVLLQLSSDFLKVYLGSMNIPLLSDSNAFAFFLYGLLIVLVVRFAPDGIVGVLNRWIRKWRTT